MGNQNATAGVPEKEKTAGQVPDQVSASDHDQSSHLGGNDSVVLEKQSSSSAANDHDPAHVDNEASDHAREEERPDQIPEISTSKHDQSSSSGGNDVIVLEKQRSSSAANDYDLSGASDVIKEESHHTKGTENDEAAAKPSNIEPINQDSAAKPNDSAGGSSLGGGVFDDTLGKETISSESDSDENQQSEPFGADDEQIHELPQMELHVISTQPAEMHEIKSTRPHQNENLLESLHDLGEPLEENLTSRGIEENVNPDSPEKVHSIDGNECLLGAESAHDWIGPLNDIMKDEEPLVPPMLTSKSVLRVEEMQQELVHTISGKETMSELKNMKDHTSDSDQRQPQPTSNGHETELISQKEVIENGFQVEFSSNVVVDASHVQLLEPTNNTSVNPLQNSEERILVTEDKLKEAENKSEINQTIKAEDGGGAMDAKMTTNRQVEEEEEARGQNGDENTPSYDAGIAVEELQNEGRRNDRVFADAGSHPVEASATINGWHDYDSEPQAVSRQEILGCIEENSEDFCKTSSYKGRREGKADYEAMNFQPQMNRDQNMEVTETVDNQLTSCKEPHKTAAVQSRVHKSPSFNFDIMNIGARISEESDLTPLLYPSNTPQPQVVRSMSSPAVNQNLIVNKEYLTAYLDVSVEKTIIVERSDSEKSKTPLLSLEKEEEIGPVRERHDQNHCSLVGQTEKQAQNASSCNKESALVLRRDRDKRKPRSSTSFFSSCICCAGVNQLNSDF